MCERFETALIAHCAATLAGHKCGSLFAWQECLGEPCAELVREADALLSQKGVRARLLRRRPAGCLVYVYRPGKLKERLNNPEVRAFLRERGYADFSEEACLALLSRRVAGCAEFPHEIGVFLDYPLADVVGFIEHRGREYCCLGCWKAYSNEQEALRRFHLYRKCREVYLACHRRGFDVVRLTVVA